MTARIWHQDGVVHIDVRGLPPPRPLAQIMRLVMEQPADGVVVVHHEREPLLLYPELAQIGWCAEHVDGEPGEVRLKLQRCP